jgi:hypothetical protein
LSLNLDKTHWLQFSTRETSSGDIQIDYKDKYTEQTSSTKFLGLIIGDEISWKNQLDYRTAKLNSACFAIRTVRSVLSKDAMKMLYFSYIHSVISYGVIFWGNSPYGIKIFKIQKKIIIDNLKNGFM